MRIIRAACLIVLACCEVRAQSIDASPAFDAASVKASSPAATPGMIIGVRTTMNGGPGTNDPGRIDWVNIPLILALDQAYNVKTYQVAGPEWLNTSRFDIAATIPKGASKEQFRLMLQNLLAARFQLKLHYENRESTAYSLVVIRGGPKMKPSPEEPAPKEGAAPVAMPAPVLNLDKVEKDDDGFPVFPGARGATQASDGPRIRLRAKQETMAQFVTRLTNVLGRPVTDATGLNGK